ncbi:hypothetical protein PBI_BOGOSYJAY_49 [Mycobacterium phage BogosyJay]|nr:hypothetical protein PBI_MAMINIAINA_49 [Mycobacterium phage Maminiaina]QFG14957.1 hypothetical protein PBI_BOGOSYJAY_49 [Mycobacterium phage BogosyJay]
MSYEDPFDSAPVQQAPAEEAQQQTEPTPPPAQAPVVNNTAAPVTVSPAGDLSVTFKGDGTYTAPWIVPKYASVDAALVDLGVDAGEVAKLGQGQKWFALFDRATKMAQHFASLGGGTPNSKPAGGGGGGGQRQAPQAAKEAPNGEKKFCKHGEMEYKSGTSKKTGKPYALFSCTAPRDEQCDAQWPAK